MERLYEPKTNCLPMKYAYAAGIANSLQQISSYLLYSFRTRIFVTIVANRGLPAVNAMLQKLK